MPDVRVRDAAPGYRRHARARAHTSVMGHDPTHLHTFHFKADFRAPEITLRPTERARDNVLEPRHDRSVRLF